MVLFKIAGLTCSMENQVPPFFVPCLQGRARGKSRRLCLFLPCPTFLYETDICAKPLSLHSLDRLCASCTLFICNICRDRHSKQSICTIFRDRYIFFYILELCYQGPYLEPEPGWRNRYDMTWNQLGIKICMIS